MKETVRKFIEKEGLFTQRDRIAVGVSGGADSVALLALLCELGYDCVALHCNFHLRGEESLRDERFVEQWVKSSNIELRKADFDTVGFASGRGISIEMAARELRYGWFSEQLEELKASCVAVAHHADDVVETFLINLTRGCGLHGLTGIKPKNGRVVRPLLCVGRKDILQYLEAKGLKHVEDSTNRESVYVRNKFRNDIIPLLESINPSFRSSMVQTVSNLKNTEAFLDGRVDEVRRNAMVKVDDGLWHLSIGALEKAGNLPFLLFELLRPFGFSPATTRSIADGISGGGPGKEYLSEEYTLQRDRETLLLFRRESHRDETYSVPEGVSVLEEPVKLQFTIEGASDAVITKSKSTCYLDYGKLKFPLEIRRWRRGDWFVPFGMKGRKKLSDFFVDNRFSVYKKNHTWLLTSDDQVVWVVGERGDNRFRISPETEKILKIEIRQ